MAEILSEMAPKMLSHLPTLNDFNLTTEANSRDVSFKIPNARLWLRYKAFNMPSVVGAVLAATLV